MFKARREAANDGDIMLTASQKYGMLPQSEFIEKEGRRVVEVIQGKDNLIHVEPDDFVISMRSFQGGLEWCRFTGSTSFHYVPVTPIKHVVPAFFAYLLKCNRYISALRSTTNLIRDGQEIRYSNFVQVPLPTIPASEQRAIATFLVHETAKIDALIAEQQRLIELLQEMRQAVISHAVTKGLNPDAPMKDSGVEWLGEVPEHWEVLRLRFAVTLNPSKQELNKLSEQELVSFLPMEAIGEDGSLRLEHEKQIEECLSGYTYFRDGDVCVAKITPCFENGKGAILRGLKGGIGFGTTELIVARPREGMITVEYLDYLFRSKVFRTHGESEMYGAGGQKRVPDSFVRDFVASLPSTDEQKQVTKFLDRETAKIDALKAEQKQLIELLKERRSALISAAVTGQIDVRGLVPEVAAA
jgi:type I restriction enzyme S subunit